MTTHRARVAPLTAILLLLSLLAPAVAPGQIAGVAPLDRWYTLEMMDQPAGWMHSTRALEEDIITTTSRMELRVRRGELELSFRIDTRFRETLEGEPIEMAATTTLGGAPSTQTYRFTGEGVVQTVGSAGNERSSTLDRPEGTWLTPAAASRFLAARLNAGAKDITLRTIDPLSGLRVTSALRSDIEKTMLDIAGREVEAYRCTSIADSQPGITTTEWLDDKGDPLKMETAFGGFDLTVTASDRETATGTPAAAAPEMMASLFITPSRPIRNAHRTRFAAFTVRSTEGDLPALPTTGYQRSGRLDAGSARVTIDMTTPPEPVGDDTKVAFYTASTAYLAHDDPAVAALARRAVGDRATLPPGRIAEDLRRFVHQHIVSKDLSVGFATASETARSGEGDCTEHAVLLAALLRARGIPSRVVSGLIYADAFAGGRDIFGYHMWTQAMLKDEEGVSRWHDLDATLPGPRGYNAAHIALAVSALEDAGPVGGLAELAPLLGRLAIEVEETR